MPPFTVNANRVDPYKNFKFRVKWDNRYVAGVSKVGALKRTTEVVKHRDGGDPSTSRKSPGRTEFEAITLERGVTHDLDFEQWANRVCRRNRSEIEGNEASFSHQPSQPHVPYARSGPMRTLCARPGTECVPAGGAEIAEYF